MSSYFLCGVIQVSMKGRDSSCIHVGENVTQPAPTFMLQSSNIFSCSVVFEITSHKQLSVSVFSEVAIAIHLVELFQSVKLQISYVD